MGNQEMPEWVETVIETTLKAKRALCDFANGPADGMPILIWRTDEQTHIVPLPTPNDDFTMADIISNIYKEVWAELGTPLRGALVSEAYVKTYREGEVPKFTKGEAKKELGTNPNVSECITIMSFNKEGLIKHSVLPYRYDDSGLPQFDEIVYADDMGGSVAEATHNFLDFINAK